MQMVMIIIGGYVVASTPLVQRAMQKLAGLPQLRAKPSPWSRSSPLSPLLSWGMSPIISGLFVRQLTQRIKGLDYRAAGAAAYARRNSRVGARDFVLRRDADGHQEARSRPSCSPSAA